jgi:hypothetical protein
VQSHEQYKEHMAIEIETPIGGRTIVIGVRQSDEAARLASKDLIECTLEGWSEADLAEAAKWTHVNIKGRRYKIVTALGPGAFKIQLNE